MKKLLIATILLTGFAAFVPSAKAEHCEQVFVGYDRCGNPVYREVVRPRVSYYQERPTYYRSAPQVQVRYRSYEREDDRRCRETRRPVSPLSFIFGF